MRLKVRGSRFEVQGSRFKVAGCLAVRGTRYAVTGCWLFLCENLRIYICDPEASGLREITLFPVSCRSQPCRLISGGLYLLPCRPHSES
ncbi:MAG TPA: hypothetical protein DCY25_02765 [Bacteroidales bacterium]|nr:hypothetical protein [Bacteroidales bacterium]